MRFVMASTTTTAIAAAAAVVVVALLIVFVVVLRSTSAQARARKQQRQQLQQAAGSGRGFGQPEPTSSVAWQRQQAAVQQPWQVGAQQPVPGWQPPGPQMSWSQEGDQWQQGYAQPWSQGAGMTPEPASPWSQPGQPAAPASPWSQPGQSAAPASPWSQPGQSAAPASPWSQPGQPAAPASPWSQPAQAATPGTPWGQPAQQPAAPVQSQWGVPGGDVVAAPGQASWSQAPVAPGSGSTSRAPWETVPGGGPMPGSDSVNSAMGQNGAFRVPVIVVRQGKEPGRTYEIRKDRLSMGRSRESDIFLEDLAVSRLHASIYRDASGSYHLRDENSANGTTVNGQRISDHILQDGDEIQLGQTVLSFTHR
jgi:hypothetical protein